MQVDRLSKIMKTTRSLRFRQRAVLTVWTRGCLMMLGPTIISHMLCYFGFFWYLRDEIFSRRTSNRSVSGGIAAEGT